MSTQSPPTRASEPARMDRWTPETIREDVLVAAKRIAPHIAKTDLAWSPYLSGNGGARIFLKCENLQVTRSFKIRGACNALLAMSEAARSAGVVTSSTGNHANAMAHAARVLGVDCEIWVPTATAPVKVEQLRVRGTDLRLVDGDPSEVEIAAREEAHATRRRFVSPYNDPDVIAGQGTVAHEILADLDAVTDVVVPVGGGGLIAGIAGYLKATSPRVRIVGVQPENSPVMAASVAAGELLRPPWRPSLADAVVGWSEPGSITFDMCRDWVDEWCTVSEDDIAGALRTIIARESMLVEGAGALPVAALLADSEAFSGDRRVVCVLSGARVSLKTLRRVLEAA